jgi:hypothetical protein
MIAQNDGIKRRTVTVTVRLWYRRGFLINPTAFPCPFGKTTHLLARKLSQH